MSYLSKHNFLLAIALGILLSVLLGWGIYTKETKHIELDFRNDVNDKAAALERELGLNLEALYSIKGLFDSSEHVTRAEFSQITQSIFIRHKAIQALEWLPKILDAQRDRFEKTTQQTYPDFEITQRATHNRMIRAQQRQVYFPVHYVEPMAGNEVAFGVDSASNPKAKKTLEMSRDLGIPLASASITLVQETANQKGFLIFMPIYDGQPTTVEKRRLRLKGLVLAVFRIGDIFANAIKRTTADSITLALIDNTSSSAEVMINTDSSEQSLSATSRFQYEKQLLSLGGRQWSIIATPTIGYIAERRTILPYATSLIGMLLVAIGAAYSLIVLRRTALIEQTVLDRTKDLNNAKKELELLTKTDSLTGIANRRHFTEYLDAEWNRAIRNTTPLSLIMIDIDHFKDFNDKHGHLAGDECLKKVARSLQNTFPRSTDLIARFGGEEFIAVLPNTQKPEILAEQCRQAIENLQVPIDDADTSSFVTISVGVTTTIPDESAILLEFERNADRALYKAKESGRNRVCSNSDSNGASADTENTLHSV